MPPVAYHFRCIGKVQGVFYRASTKERAEILGVKGWVKNESNGDVTIHAEGEEQIVLYLYHWCKQGPVLARVDEVVKTNVEVEGFDEFEVRYL